MRGVGPVGAVAVLSFWASLRGLRALALAAFAVVPTLIVLALVGARASTSQIGDAAQGLFLELTIPIVSIVIVLLLSVGQFRTEIDDDTLGYLTSRSIPREGIVLGKYLGSTGAALVFLVPTALLPIAVALAAGAPSLPDGALGAIVAITVLAAVAYGALFLLLGLVTSWALLLGLLLGFLWEELLVNLPGSFPRLTVIFYLRSLASDLVGSGPLSGYTIALPTADAVLAPIAAAVVFVVAGMATIRVVELAPERSSA